jgi:hypothetical protein
MFSINLFGHSETLPHFRTSTNIFCQYFPFIFPRYWNKVSSGIPVSCTTLCVYQNESKTHAVLLQQILHKS